MQMCRGKRLQDGQLASRRERDVTGKRGSVAEQPLDGGREIGRPNSVPVQTQTLAVRLERDPSYSHTKHRHTHSSWLNIRDQEKLGSPQPRGS